MRCSVVFNRLAVIYYFLILKPTKCENNQKIIFTNTGNNETESSEENSNNQQTKIPNLTNYEKHKDFFTLNPQNYAMIFSTYDPWILIFHDNEHVSTSWKTMAASLRGIVWVGVIDKDDGVTLIHLGYEGIMVPNSLVLPYGTKKFKQKNMKSASTPLESKNLAVQSLPDKFFTVTSREIKDYFMDSFTAPTSQFPALLFHSNKLIPDVFKALAIRFEKYFNFGVLINPSHEDLAAIGLQNHYFEMPAFCVMVTTDPIEPKVNAVFYNIEDMGEMNYPNLMKFLFYVNGEYRHYLPGVNKSNMKTEALMLDIQDIEKKRFDFVDSNQNDVKSKKYKTEL